MANKPPRKTETKDDTGGTGLPASIEAVWGLRERPGKGPKPGLSLERIVEAAVSVAASEGLAAVSMSRVATELGAATMSLYRYISAKDELLALMVDAAMGAPPAAPAPGEGWREGLSRWAWAFRAILRQHSWILHIPVSGPPATPHQIAWMEYGLGCLRGTGLAEGEKVSVVILLSGFVRNETSLGLTSSAAFPASGSKVRSSAPTYGRLLAKLTDAQRFPALTATIASGALDQPDEPDAEFIFGLERILDGIDVLVRARTR